MTHRMAVGGLVALILAGGSAPAWADWKTRAARKTVGHAAKEGMEHAVKDTVIDAALGDGLPDRSRPGVIDRPKRDGEGQLGSDARPKRDGEGRLGKDAGQGLEGALRAADMGSDMADAARTLNRARKVIR